jgi:hypothetical protein
VSDLGGFRLALDHLVELKQEAQEAVLADKRPDPSTVIETSLTRNKVADQHRMLLEAGETVSLEAWSAVRSRRPHIRGPIRLAAVPTSPPCAPDANKVRAHAEAFAEVVRMSEVDPSELWQGLSEIETRKLSNALLAVRQWVEAAEKAKP